MENINLPGIFSIEYYLCSNVTLPLMSKYKTIDLSLYTSDQPTAIEFIPGTASLKGNLKQPKAGDYFEINIPFEVAGTDTQQLDQVKSSHHLFVITDKNKLKYLIGFSASTFADLTFNQKIDATGQGGKSIQAQISWKTNIFPVYVA